MRHWLMLCLAAAVLSPHPALAQETPAAVAPDPRAGDPHHEQSQRLMRAVEEVLRRAAEARGEAKTLPSREKFVIPPIWTETREDREQTIRPLLDAALDIIADAPVVALQTEMATRRKSIAGLRERMAALREKRLEAPDSGLLPGLLTDTRASIDADIAAMEGDIRRNEAEIARLKGEVAAALKASGVEVSPEQLDLLLESVIGSDLLKLVAAFEIARGVDARLAERLTLAEGDLKLARRYFATHAALFAMLVHAQTMVIEDIDRIYLAKLKAVIADVKAAREQTYRLMGAQNRPDQRRALEANLKAQENAEKAAAYYRDYLLTQRRQIADARARAVHDLQIADNTFETVEASFQLRALIENARASFEALMRLEAPGFDQIFQNESLRKEFENLTEKIGPQS
ncbi:MAG: hypothetical protein NW215_13455 [Hyphomicrobiales bacterium]|nr:hypothetical protein [Hyphomicrobiales bacterium]